MSPTGKLLIWIVTQINTNTTTAAAAAATTTTTITKTQLLLDVW